MMSHSSSANDVCSIQDLSCCTQEYAAALRHSTRAMQNRLAGCFRPATAPASNLNHRRCFCIVTLRCTTCALHQLGHRRRGRMRWGDLWCVHTGDITSMYIFNLFFDGCMEFDKFDKFLNCQLKLIASPLHHHHHSSLHQDWLFFSFCFAFDFYSDSGIACVMVSHPKHAHIHQHERAHDTACSRRAASTIN